MRRGVRVETTIGPETCFVVGVKWQGLFRKEGSDGEAIFLGGIAGFVVVSGF